MFDGGAYDKCKRYEEKTVSEIMSLLAPTFASLGLRPEMVTDRKRQIECGDVQMFDMHGIHRYVDIKSEKKSSPNMFFEHKSNAVDGWRNKDGWGWSIAADRIWYHFSDSRAMAVVNLPRMRAWLESKSGQPRTSLYRLVTQGKHAQLNVTSGYLVPWQDMPREVFKDAWLLDEGDVRRCSPDEFLDRLEETAISHGRFFRRSKPACLDS